MDRVSCKQYLLEHSLLHTIYTISCPRRVAKLCGSVAIKCGRIKALMGNFNCYCGFRTCLRIETIGENWSEMKTRWTTQQRERERKRKVMLKAVRRSLVISTIDIHTLRNRYRDGLDPDGSMSSLLVRLKIRTVQEAAVSYGLLR
jgi:cytochrome bd-type quinol oxidase subunit 2